jgi:hypothetical protein
VRGSGGREEEDGAGKMATSSACPVDRLFRSVPRGIISELRDVHHSPDGNFCMRAYLRRVIAAVEDSGWSAVRILSVSRGMEGFDCEAWSSRDRAKLQNRSCWALGVFGGERE